MRTECGLRLHDPEAAADARKRLPEGQLRYSEFLVLWENYNPQGGSLNVNKFPFGWIIRKYPYAAIEGCISRWSRFGLHAPGH